MNKTAIRNFAVWARVKLREEIRTRAGFVGITESGIAQPLPASTSEIKYFEVGSAQPVSLSGEKLRERTKLVNKLEQKVKDGDYKAVYDEMIENYAYDWFNRLIAIRFMEVNEYFSDNLRVLSSTEEGRQDPDIVSLPFSSDLEFTDAEREKILEWKTKNENDKLFRFLLLKRCNQLHKLLPGIFQEAGDDSELMMRLSFIDKDGVIYHLVHDIEEEDWKEQVQIIGWIYQYYNSELKDETFALAKKGKKITKERIPSATQLFTPDWIVRYMVENSLGRLWLEGHPDDELKSGWKYYLEEAEQEPDVQEQLEEIRKEYQKLTPKELTFIDPCMGSGHILVYAFDVLMQIYESQGYTKRDAVQSILKNNLYGLDIDDRAYQLAYFSVMMKARQYDARILERGIEPQVYAIQESNGIKKEHLLYLGKGLLEQEKTLAVNQLQGLIKVFLGGKSYGSILKIESCDWGLLRKFICKTCNAGQLQLETIGIEQTQAILANLVDVAQILSSKYKVVLTNPPYMGNAGFQTELTDYTKVHYPNSKNDLYSVMIEKAQRLAGEHFFVAMITMQSWMNAPTFKKLRKSLFESVTFNQIVNMGSRGFEEIKGEKVKNTIFIFSNDTIENWKPLFMDLTSVQGENEKRNLFLKRESLYNFTKQQEFLKHEQCLVIYKTKHVEDILSPKQRISDVAEVHRCIATGNDERFIRKWTEVNASSISSLEKREEDKKWYFVANGGERRRWYGNISEVLNWNNNGEELHAFHNVTKKSTFRNVSFMFKEGATYTYTSMGSGVFHARKLLQGMASIGVGPVVTDTKDDIYMIGYINSSVFRWFWDTMYGKVSTFETGNVNKVAWKYQSEEEVKPLVKRCIELSKIDWNMQETAFEFQNSPFIPDEINVGSKVKDIYSEFDNICINRMNEVKECEEKINKIFIEMYGLQDEVDFHVDEKEITLYKPNRKTDIRRLISYAVGCMFGRYSLDTSGLAYAGGDWDTSKYTTFIPEADNILPITDTRYLDNDIVELFIKWLTVVYGEDTLEENLEFIAQALGNKGADSREVIRNYFIKDFFKEHCAMYSVTGSGKRPIYWLLDSGKQNGFKALIYMHRYNAGTIGRVRTSYLHPIQKKYESEVQAIEEMTLHMTDQRQITAEEKRKEKLLKQIAEVKEYDEKLDHLISEKIEIDLDDGVKVNYEKVQTDRDGIKYQILAPIK